jgi:type IV pilus assembly protein PilA
MSYKNSKTSDGFTIIEVLIVLAIAGLILLIVFLAVPALQRNSRNTAMKNDVQNVIGGVSEFQGANNGTLPDDISGTGNITYKKTTGGNTTTIDVQGTTIVQTATGSFPNLSAAGVTGPSNGTIQIYLKKDCQGNTNSRSVAAIYSIETKSNPQTIQCTES